MELPRPPSRRIIDIPIAFPRPEPTTTPLVVGRLGWSLARLIDRRASRPQDSSGETVERHRALEDEQLVLRQELSELQERQDFTERVLLRGQGAMPNAPDPLPDRIPTPR